MIINDDVDARFDLLARWLRNSLRPARNPRRCHDANTPPPRRRRRLRDQQNSSARTIYQCDSKNVHRTTINSNPTRLALSVRFDGMNAVYCIDSATVKTDRKEQQTLMQDRPKLHCFTNGKLVEKYSEYQAHYEVRRVA
jgi:hypothetical protein